MDVKPLNISLSLDSERVVDIVEKVAQETTGIPEVF